MAQKKSSRKNKPINLDRIVEGEFRVPYFELKSDKYVGVVAIVTEDKGNIGNGLEATGLLDHKMEGRWEMFYRNNNHYGYDIAIVGIKKGERDTIEKRIGEFSEEDGYKPKGLTVEQKSRLFINGVGLSEAGKNMLGGILELVENDPDEYLMTRRQAA